MITLSDASFKSKEEELSSSWLSRLLKIYNPLGER
jgi:hypothetical protein